MSNGPLKLQKAIYAALVGDATLSAKITGVYDSVPQSQSFPFVVIGEGDFEAFDTHTQNGFEGILTVHTWSRGRGRAEVLDLQSDLYRILHENYFSLTGYRVIVNRFQFQQTLVDPDGVTYHGITRFRIMMGET